MLEAALGALHDRRSRPAGVRPRPARRGRRAARARANARTPGRGAVLRKLGRHDEALAAFGGARRSRATRTMARSAARGRRGALYLNKGQSLLALGRRARRSTSSSTRS